MIDGYGVSHPDPTYDEILAKNSLEAVHETLRHCATQPCHLDYFYGIPPVVLPFALAVTEEIKVKDPDCIILISGTPGDGIWLKVHRRDGTVMGCDIETDDLNCYQYPDKGEPRLAFWSAT